MPISFLNPGLLFGAAAAALPVILHFLSRRRVRRESFSDLRFLEQAQSRQARSLGVRRWLLLLLRVLALLLLVAGAAGPRWGGLGATSGAGSYLFVIDASASSGARRGPGTVLDAATADAAAMIAQLPAGATVQVIVAGSRTEALFGDWLPAGSAAAGALGALAATDGGFDLAAVFREAARQAARAPGAPVDVVLLGDLQSVPSDPAWPDAVRALRQARDSRVLLRDVAPDRGEAGGVVEVRVPRRALRPGEAILVGARVVAAREGEVFTLDLDGRAVAEATATGPAGRPQDVDFALTVPGPGLHTGIVRKESDVLAADDRRPFVLVVPPRLDVLVVHGPDRPGDGPAGRGGWRYLAEALSPGGGPGPFAVSSQSSDAVTTGALAAAGVVVLVDPESLGRAGLDALVARLGAGGGVLLAAGDPLVVAHLDDVLLPALGLPVGVRPETAVGEGVHARIVDASHPLFAGFDDAARRACEDIRWRRWLGHVPDGSRVVLELAGGEPLLLERESGDGRLAVLATHFGPDAGDLSRSPLAVPLLQRLCAWLGGGAGREGAIDVLVGQEIRLSPRLGAPAAALADAGALTVAGPLAGVARAAELEWRAGAPVLGTGPADRAGFAVFLSGPDTLGIAAVGVPAAETLEQRDGPGGWRQRLASLGMPVVADLSGADPLRLADALGGRNLAPWAFLLAAVLLALELAVGSGAGRGNSGGS
ncbi:MAG: BatA domain-containing protein [bacterium]|nr:BatA domain-containing protein [bacterium]